MTEFQKSERNYRRLSKTAFGKPMDAPLSDAMGGQVAARVNLCGGIQSGEFCALQFELLPRGVKHIFNLAIGEDDNDLQFELLLRSETLGPLPKNLFSDDLQCKPLGVKLDTD